MNHNLSTTTILSRITQNYIYAAGQVENEGDGADTVFMISEADNPDNYRYNF